MAATACLFVRGDNGLSEVLRAGQFSENNVIQDSVRSMRLADFMADNDIAATAFPYRHNNREGVFMSGSANDALAIGNYLAEGRMISRAPQAVPVAANEQHIVIPFAKAARLAAPLKGAFTPAARDAAPAYTQSSRPSIRGSHLMAA